VAQPPLPRHIPGRRPDRGQHVTVRVLPNYPLWDSQCVCCRITLYGIKATPPASQALAGRCPAGRPVRLATLRAALWAVLGRGRFSGRYRTVGPRHRGFLV